MGLSTLKRDHIKRNLKNEEYDVVIIGGGITGAGIALDASNRGMKVALVEMQDFAQGTSSRSTKLVHGGLRYLKQLQVGVVAETGKERAIVYENGPHVTTPEWMLLPMHKGGTFGKFTTAIGLTMYDRLAGVKKSERKKMLSKQDTINKEPLVKQDGLKGGGYYVEYRTDDARLTIEVMKKAAEKGAEIINYTKSEHFTYDSNKKVNGIEVVDMIDNETYPIKAKKVINASGPWVDEVRSGDYARNNKQLRLTKGVHVVIDQSKFPLQQAVYFDTEKDGRMIFAIPREGKAYVGTTDTFYDNEKATPLTTQEDRDYLIDAINYMFPTVDVKDEDIESTWAGVRPLILEEGKDPSEISRKDEVWEGESGLLTIAGGKLTGYRHMALEIVDLLAKRLKKEYGLTFKPCATKELKISGGDVGGSKNFDHFVKQKVDAAKGFGIDEDVAYRLASKYGSNVDDLFNIAQTAQYHTSQLPLEIYVELIYGIQQEMVFKPTDFLVRRSGKLYFNIDDVLQYKDAVIDVLADMLQYSEGQKQAYTDEVNKAIDEAQSGNNQPAVKE
ncbi:glycerol-3-phosphate dehydrogenase/oxidase [Staphylococcus warneri]|jgi:glycerol-3-phosphate dehydrogenase|uniref:Glycerol-3-phosphate dehydrogenase n=1 Tax=Staphylococcus warneri TaxID=1292 RepID=A0A2T4Q2V5_STAWA|nr:MULTISPECIES: glycerol-3-phosphate dehydrogenase/oxidase [Staphylococcus]MBE9428620.1 glycerol-3-phosphate dehydrogenase/oxidase [Staphylococcus epidermidis]MBY6181274.1 glycerol-3-phosphate dehydrogenase/oxidase [Staphylococcaceae bacterium DP2N0-1]AXV42517.1 DNA-directed DNA polymerase III subunit gamma and tau [Staphylococcus sp. M0911]EEQ79841.1 FAD dependent oxidoreductase [Staphylococcus warneri L37603]MBO0378687.1 glycerol-3-phosphate dehydrogenase/oxidase [Staphylococcus warneri]